MTMEKKDIERYFQSQRSTRCARLEGDIGDEKHGKLTKIQEKAVKQRRLNEMADKMVAETQKFLDTEFEEVLNRKVVKKLVRKSDKEHPVVKHMQYVLDKHEEIQKKNRQKRKKVKKPSIPKETLEDHFNSFNSKLLTTRERYGLGYKEPEFGENYLYDNFKYGSAYEKMIFDRDEKLGLNRSKLVACQKARDYDAEKLLNMKVDGLESFEVFNNKAKELMKGTFKFKNVHHMPETDFPDEFLFYLRMQEDAK